MEENTNVASVASKLADEIGIITEDTKVIGNIDTMGHLDIVGYVEGNISAEGNIAVKGVIKGDITCNDLLLDRCTVTSQIISRGAVTIKNGSVVNGNIHCDVIRVQGTVNGDISASNNVIILGGAEIKGNVSTKFLSVGEGAKLNGNIKMV